MELESHNRREIMNVGVILIGLVLIFAAAIGIIAMASANAAPPVDTMGNTLSAESNNTHEVITNTSAPLAQYGGGLGLAIAVLFVCGTLFAVFALILYGKAGGRSSNR